MIISSSVGSHYSTLLGMNVLHRRALSKQSGVGMQNMHVAKHVCAPRENGSISLLKKALRIFIAGSNDVS